MAKIIKMIENENSQKTFIFDDEVIVETAGKYFGLYADYYMEVKHKNESFYAHLETHMGGILSSSSHIPHKYAEYVKQTDSRFKTL